MLFYFFLFAFFALGAILHRRRPSQLSSRATWFAVVVLIIVIGFRWKVGSDWNTYQILLRLAGNSAEGLNVRAEPAYAFLNVIAYDQNWDIWFPNLVCAAIFTAGLVTFARQQPNPWLALVAAVPYMIIGVGMGFTRQSAAVGLILLAIVQLGKSKRWRMFGTILLASMFHTSAIVMAPVLAIANARRAVVVAILLVVFSFALYFGFSERIAERANEYTKYRYVAGGAIPRIAMNVIPASLFLLYRRRFAEGDELRFWTIMSLMAFMTVVLLGFVSSSTIVDRLGIFIVPLQIFVLGRIPFVFGEKGEQSAAAMFAVIAYSFAVLFLWFNFGKESENWVPYRNYLWEHAFSQ